MNHGDNLAPASLMFVMQLTAEEIIAALKEMNARIINIKHDDANGKMKLCNLKDTKYLSEK